MLHTFRKGVRMSDDRSSLHTGHRVDRNRRSAKQTIEELVTEIIKRPDCDEKKNKLDLLQTIFSRMSWTDLFNKIQFRHRDNIQKAHWYVD